jgi:signal transduction histidine kinase
VHGLSHQLHPAKLEQLGLVAAVGSLCTDFAKSHGRAIAFEHQGIPAKLPDDTALCLYRIVQESLQNVIKHSDAQRAVVALSGDADWVCLQILDDGKGFDAKFADGNAGLGLVSIRERLHLVDGQITIDSKAGAGTRIVVRVPACSRTPTAELS